MMNQISLNHSDAVNNTEKKKHAVAEILSLCIAIIWLHKVLLNFKICFYSQSNKTGMRFNSPSDFPMVTKPEFLQFNT